MRQIEKRFEDWIEKGIVFLAPGHLWREQLKKIIEKRERLKMIAKEQNELFRLELYCLELRKPKVSS
jgi:hypothetical protein